MKYRAMKDRGLTNVFQVLLDRLIALINFILCQRMDLATLSHKDLCILTNLG